MLLQLTTSINFKHRRRIISWCWMSSDNFLLYYKIVEMYFLFIVFSRTEAVYEHGNEWRTCKANWCLSKRGILSTLQSILMFRFEVEAVIGLLSRLLVSLSVYKLMRNTIKGLYLPVQSVRLCTASCFWRNSFGLIFLWFRSM